MKKCPFCAEEIQDEAVICRYCGSSLTEKELVLTTSSRTSSTLEQALVPYLQTGFDVVNKSESMATLRKAKKFNWAAFLAWTFLSAGWLIWVYPIYYLFQSEKNTTFRLVNGEWTPSGYILPHLRPQGVEKPRSTQNKQEGYDAGKIIIIAFGVIIIGACLMILLINNL